MSSFVDANVVVYAYDSQHPEKQAKALALLHALMTAGDLVSSAQVLNESYSILHGKLRMDSRRAEEAVGFLQQGRVVALTAELSRAAIARHRKDTIAFWDALILEAALEAGCTTLYSEDFQHGRRFGKLTIKNPFG